MCYWFLGCIWMEAKGKPTKRKLYKLSEKETQFMGGGGLIIISGYSSICQEVETTLIFAH